MRFIASFVVLILLGVALALAQQPPAQRPTAAQITENLMEGEIANYRRQAAQLAEQVNKLTDERDTLKKQLESCPTAGGAEPKK